LLAYSWLPAVNLDVDIDAEKRSVMAGGDASETSGGLSEFSRSLEFTPTWVLATVASVFVIISIAVERLLHFLGNVCTLLTVQNCDFQHTY